MREKEDAYWLDRAATLARRGQGRTRPNPPVGAVIVKGGEVVGQGWHRKAGSPHAEVYALRQAGDDARGATAYISLEPCSTVGRTGACTDALIRAGIETVVYGCADPNPTHRNRARGVLQKAGIICRSMRHEECAALAGTF